MKWLALLCCLATTSVSSLLAQQTSASGDLPPTTTQVMSFYEVMHVREQTQSRLEAQQKQIRIMIADVFSKKLPGATPKQRKDFDEFMDSMVGDAFKDYPIDDILRDLVPVYQKHMTESDLNAVVTFYSSPVGQKLLSEMPAMTSEAMRISYAHLQPRIEEMMKKAEAYAGKMAESPGKVTPSLKK